MVGDAAGDGAADKADADAADLSGDAAKTDVPKDASDGGGGDASGDVGGPPPCMVATDCPGMDSECQHRACTAGVCGIANEAAGKVLATQIIGDCKVRQCGANGAVAIVNDNTDIPDDINACTKDACAAGVASHTPVAANTTCGGGKLCSASGQCMGCNSPADCPGTDNFCRTRTCVQNVCGVTFTAAGTKLVDATSGDCKIQQCDGMGVIQTVAAPADLPVDNNPCTQDQCNGTTPTHQPVARNTVCGTGQVCDGASHCVTCLIASTCPGTDTECQARTCVNGACGTSFTAAGTPVMSQIAGDCKKNQCDGHGGVVSVIDNNDPLVDNNPCTSDLCSSGVPTNQPVATRTNCGANLQCDGVGHCVQCIGVGDCPGTDNECQQRTCISGACGVKLTAAGTAVSNQTTGDCKVNQCDGKGAVVTVNDDTDPQNDNNPCTNDICSGGVVSHTNLSLHASCGTNLECDGNGNCVNCVMASECGTDGPCVTYACNNHVCGHSFVAAGTLTANQMAMNCKKNVCDGQGNAVDVPDDADKPVDGLDCTADVCTNGQPSNPNLPNTMMCSMAGGKICNGGGVCVQCLGDSDCGMDTTGCVTNKCTIVGTCTVSFAAAGTTPIVNGKAITQVVGDCQDIVCDGSGHQALTPDDNDKPNDGIDCTADICTNGVASHPSLNTSATCNQNGGTHCDGAGNCVQCNTDAQCGNANDTLCLKNTCVNHSCTTASSPPAGTLPMAAQVVGDCQDLACDASHNVIQVLNAQDLPPNSNVCVTLSCNGTMVVSTPVPAGSVTCGGGTGKCNGDGRCDTCLADTDCGTNNECATYTCNTGTGMCQNQFASAGFVVASQIPGDCKQRQCDGTGNPPAAVPLPSDTPNDMNSCTMDTCGGADGSVPTFTNLPERTDCTTQGGPAMFCSGGACVGCLQASDCGADSTDGCTVHTCVANTCGRNDPPDGTVLAMTFQTTGDCQKVVCNGIGGTKKVADDSDLPDDGKICTMNLCMSGVPSNPALGAGTSCGQNKACDGSQVCSPTFMVVRVGSPAGAAPTSAGTAVSIETRTQSDATLVGSPLALPSGSTDAHPFTLSGAADSEGALARSPDGHNVTLAGYGVAAGTTGVAGNTATVTPRAVAIINAMGTINTSTTLGTIAFSKNNVRSAVTNDGSEFWIGGAGDKPINAGVFYAASVGASTSGQIESGTNSTRVCQIYFGVLYCTAKASPNNSVFAVGPPNNPLPQSLIPMGMGLTPLYASAATASPYAFALIDTNSDGAADVLYVADETAPGADRTVQSGGIQKWTLIANTWTFQGTFNNGLTDGVRGLAVDNSGGSIVLIASTAPNTSAMYVPDAIVTYVDDGTPPSTAKPFTTLVPAATTANAPFRGIALPPVP